LRRDLHAVAAEQGGLIDGFAHDSRRLYRGFWNDSSIGRGAQYCRADTTIITIA
jgi:hypothetical protein